MLFSRRPVDSLENVLATCLDDIDAGVPLEELLARYPQYAADLGPLLAVAVQMRSAPWPALSARGRVQGREQMHAALAQYHAGFSRWRPTWAQTAMALAIVASVSAFSFLATQPGRLIAPIAPAPIAAPRATTTSERPPVAPTDTATATSTTEPSSTPTSEVATATSTLTATPRVDGQPGTLVLPSPSSRPSATASLNITVTTPLTLTVTPTGTLVMRSSQMPQSTRASDTPVAPSPTPIRPTITSVPTTRVPEATKAPAATATSAPVPPGVITIQPQPRPTSHPTQPAATAQPTNPPPLATSPVNITPQPIGTPRNK